MAGHAHHLSYLTAATSIAMKKKTHAYMDIYVAYIGGEDQENDALTNGNKWFPT